MARPNFDKTTGQSYSAAEWGQLKDKNNNPGLNDAWSSIVKFDDEYFPPDKTMTGAITYTIDATNAGTGNGRKDTIIGDGNDITFTGFTIRKSSLSASSNVITTVAGIEYSIVFLRVGSISEVYLATNGTAGSTQLSPPTGLQASAGDAEVSLSWAAVLSATGYTLQFHDGDLVWADVPAYDGTSTNYTHTSLVNGTIYFYRVKATAAGYIDSAYSQINATPSLGITVLTAPILDSLTPANAQITVNFTNNGGGNEDDTLPQYRVTAVGGAWSNATPFVTGATSGIIDSLVNGTEYDVQLIHRGSGSYSNSVASNTLTSTPIEGTIYDTLTQIEMIFDDAGLALSTDNTYGVVDGAGEVSVWRSITPADNIADTFAWNIQAAFPFPNLDNGVLLSNGEQLSTDVSGPTNQWEFLTELRGGVPGNLKWTIHLVLKCPNISGNTVYVINNFTTSTRADAIVIRFNDNPDTNALAFFFYNNANQAIVEGTIQNAFVDNGLAQVITLTYDHSLASDNFKAYNNKSLTGQVTKSNDPDAGSNTRGMLMQGVPTQMYYNTMVFQQVVESDTIRNNFIDALMAKYSIT